MKRYTCNFTKKEIWEFCLRAFWEQIKLQKVTWIIMVAVCLAEAIVDYKVTIILLSMLLFMMAFAAIRSYFVSKKPLGRQRTTWVENGFLKVSTDTYGEVPLSSIDVIRTGKNLIMLGMTQSKKRVSWFPIPRRVFENERELEAFLNAVRGLETPDGREEDFAGEAGTEAVPEQRHGQNAAAAQTLGVPDVQTAAAASENAEAVGAQAPETAAAGWGDMPFTFSHEVDEERWMQIAGEATEAIRAGTLGMPDETKNLLGVSLTALIAVTVLFLIFEGTKAFYLFILIVLLYAVLLLKSLRSDPAKKLRKQFRTKGIRENICGTWEVSFSDTGVMEKGAGSIKNVIPWSEMKWLIETEHNFYLFHKLKRNFVTIPKECLETEAETEAFLALCREKEVTVLKGKRMKYLPGWAFVMMYIGVIIIYMAVIVCISFRQAQREAQERMLQQAQESSWQEEFDPADYPDYVPLSKQVEVLRTLGFTVPDETVREVEESLDEYGMRVYVEGYPYAWLLSELGMPSYDENWEISGYPREVFWFDFEGWNIETDYIEILTGMQVLAQGSVLDSVTQIGEDTEKVDWENGSGTLELSFQWKGIPYSWTFKVENDWIDPDVLGIFNKLLETEQVAERFYVTGDYGQGALVFYRTPEWAEQFEKATGLVLEAPVVKSGTAGSVIL